MIYQQRITENQVPFKSAMTITMSPHLFKSELRLKVYLVTFSKHKISLINLMKRVIESRILNHTPRKMRAKTSIYKEHRIANINKEGLNQFMDLQLWMVKISGNKPKIKWLLMPVHIRIITCLQSRVIFNNTQKLIRKH